MRFALLASVLLAAAADALAIGPKTIMHVPATDVGARIPGDSSTTIHVRFDGVGPVDSTGASWTTVGTVPQVSEPASVSGPLLRSAGPFSDSNYYQLGTGSDAGDFAGAFTACVIMRPVDLTGDPIIIGNGSYNSSGYYLQTRANGQVEFVDKATETFASGTLTLNATNVVCWGRNGATDYAKINLETTGSGAGPTIVNGTAKPLRIGRYQDAGFASAGSYVYELYMTSTPWDETKVVAIAKHALGLVATREETITVTRSTKASVTPAGGNLLLDSEIVTPNAAWSNLGNDNTFAMGVATLPDGTTGGTRIGVSGVHNESWGIYQPVNYGAGPYTLSALAKAGTYGCLVMSLKNGNLNGATFDLNNGVVGEVDASTSATISYAGLGWWLITVTATPTANTQYPEFYLSQSCSANVRAWTDAGTENLIIARPHLESGSVATWYNMAGAAATSSVMRYVPPGVARLSSLGMLIEGSGVNKLRYSEQFDNGATWGTNGVTVTPDAIAGVDGQMTAEKFTVALAGGSRSVNEPMQPLTAAVYSYSIYLQGSSTSTKADMGIYDSTAGGFVAITGKIVEGPGAITNGPLASVTGLAVGQWSRAVITTTAALVNPTTITVYIYPDSAAGTVGNYIYADKGQLEPSLYATSYNGEALGTDLTRAAEVVTVPNPLKAVTNRLRQSEELDQWAWGLAGTPVVTVDQALDSEGRNTMELVDTVASAPTLWHALYQSPTGLSATWTSSAWVRPFGGSSIATVGMGCNGGTTIVSLSCGRSDGGACATDSVGGTDAQAYATVTGLTRLWVSVTCSAANTGIFYLAPGRRYTSVGKAYFSQAQIEEGLVPHEYVRTDGTYKMHGDNRFCVETTFTPEGGEAWPKVPRVMFSTYDGTHQRNMWEMFQYDDTNIYVDVWDDGGNLMRTWVNNNITGTHRIGFCNNAGAVTIWRDGVDLGAVTNATVSTGIVFDQAALVQLGSSNVTSWHPADGYFKNTRILRGATDLKSSP